MPGGRLVCQARKQAHWSERPRLSRLTQQDPIWQLFVMARGRVVDGVERCSSLYRFINFEDLV
jgi:hypothetical protein